MLRAGLSLGTTGLASTTRVLSSPLGVVDAADRRGQSRVATIAITSAAVIQAGRRHPRTFGAGASVAATSDSLIETMCGVVERPRSAASESDGMRAERVHGSLVSSAYERGLPQDSPAILQAAIVRWAVAICGAGSPYPATGPDRLHEAAFWRNSRR